MDNWLVVIVGVIFLVSIVVGYNKGFLKIGLSLLSSVLTVLLVIYLSPYVAGALEKYTPVDDMIEEWCVSAFMPEIDGTMFEGKDLTGTPFEGMDADTKQNIAKANLDKLGITIDDILGLIGEIPKDQQIQKIESSTLPGFVKKLLLENNNKMIYEELGVTSFPRYVAAYMSRMIINIASFLVTFILAIVIVKALMAAVDILGDLPVFGFLNHFGGAIVGAFVALLIVWLMFLVMTVVYSSAPGNACFDMIEKSTLLTFLYENNPILTRLLRF